MFAGIVRGVSPISEVEEQQGELKVRIKAPESSDFFDVKMGDSVAVDGVCLSLEHFSQTMRFHLGPETLRLTRWNKQNLLNRRVNLEPALRVGAFVGGHFMSAHVDGMAQITEKKQDGASVFLRVQLPKGWSDYVWKKSFIALNGVSLTVNEVKEDEIEICLIPETLRTTNLLDKKAGDWLTFEVDSYAKSIISMIKNLKT